MESTKSEAVELSTHVPRTKGRHRLPVSQGVPFPESQLKSVDQLDLRDDTGVPVPCQVKKLVSWKDGSVKWLLLNYQTESLVAPPDTWAWHDQLARIRRLPVHTSSAGTPPDTETWHNHWTPTSGRWEPGPVEKRRYILHFGDGAKRAPFTDTISISEDAQSLKVNAGRIVFSLSKKRFKLFDRLSFDGIELVGPEDEGDLIVHDAQGVEYRASNDTAFRVEVEERGELRSTIKISGTHRARDGKGFLDFVLRIVVYTGAPFLTLLHTFINKEQPEDGIKVGDIAVELSLDLGTETRRLVRHHTPGYDRLERLVSFPERAEFRADGKHVLLTNPASLGEYPDTYHVDLLNLLPEGNVEGWLGVSGSRAAVTTEICEMQQNYYKGLVSEGGHLRYSLWPAWAGPLCLRQGMAKTHRLVMAFHAALTTDEEKEEGQALARERSWAVLPFDWYRRCRVNDLDRVLPYQPGKYPRFESWLDSLFSFGSNCAEHLPCTWPYGMLDYGDAIGHWYRIGYPRLGFGLGDQVWSNNEYDFIHVALIQFCRTGDITRFREAEAAAQHLMDVDFIHYSTIPHRTGGIPHHCVGHTSGTLVSSHMFIEGLLEYYCLTGRPEALEIATRVGDNLASFPDHTPWIFWQDARECGWPLVMFSRLYEVTGEERFLKAANRVMEYYHQVNGDSGGAAFFPVGWSQLSLVFLKKYHVLTQDEKAKQLFLGATDWSVEHEVKEIALYLEGISYAYEITGDRKYAAAGLRTLLMNMERFGLGLLPRLHADVPWRYRGIVLFLNVLDQLGVLKELEYPTLEELLARAVAKAETGPAMLKGYEHLGVIGGI